MAWEGNQAFSLPMFKKGVPESWRFWIILLFPLTFQMSDAVFMGLATEISSSLSLLSQDILFCGYAGMIGVTMTFPLLFRLKFRFTTRSIFLYVCLGMATISFICMHTRFVPLMVVLSFLFGMLKLWGSFEAFSSIMLKVAPRYNFAPFLAVVFTVVFSGIEISGILGAAMTHWATWQYMNYLSIGLLLLLATVAFFLMVDFRPMPMQKLYGISWMGLLLWGLMLLSLAFIFVYGEYLDWFHSPYIYVAIALVVVTIVLNFYRMMTRRHPYLPIKAFQYRNLGHIVAVFLIACVMMSAESVLQHIYVGEILHVSSFDGLSLRVATLMGVFFGGWFGYYAIEKLGIGYKRLSFFSILLITLYEMSMCLSISADTNLASLLIPLFFYGSGHVLLFVVLTTYIEGIIPLENRFHALTILGFSRIGVGSAVGAALFGHFFSGAMNHNLALLGSQVNTSMACSLPYTEVAAEVGRQSVMLSLKQMYAFAVLLGIIALIIIAFARYRSRLKWLLPTSFR